MADALKVPVQLSVVESFRAVVCVEESLRKINFLSKLNAHTQNTSRLQAHTSTRTRKQANGFETSIGNEIVSLIAEQQELETEHSRLLDERQSLEGLVNRKKREAADKTIRETLNKLRSANQDLCTALKQNPNVQDNMVKVHRQRRCVEEWYSDCILNLNASGSFKHLIEKTAQERAEQDKVTEIKKLHRETLQAVRLLEAELRRERAAFRHESSDTHTRIQTLKNTFHTLKAANTRAIAFEEQQLSAKEEGLVCVHLQQERALESAVLKLQHEQEIDTALSMSTTEFTSHKIKQLQQERETRHGECTAKNEEAQSQFTLALKHQNSIQTKLNMTQSKLAEYEELQLLEETRARHHQFAQLQREAHKAAQLAQRHTIAHFITKFNKLTQDAQITKKQKKGNQAKKRKNNPKP